MLADALTRNRLKLRWAQWRVCLCHEASSLAISCHFLQAQALGAELDFVHRIGFGLVAFVFHGFQAACLRFQFHPVQHAAEYPASPLTHALPAQSARPCTFPARPNPPTLVQRFTLRGQTVFRPCLLVMNQGTLMQAEDVVLQGGKGNQVRILNCPWLSVENTAISLNVLEAVDLLRN